MLRIGPVGIISIIAAIGSISLYANAATPNSPDTIDTSNPQVQAQAHALARKPPLPPTRGRRIAVDDSGRKQTGKASIYAPHFQGHVMANGQRFDHREPVAASKTLPLGTVAKVTNLDNGRTAIVKVEDRGPFVSGRTLDLTKATASQLGIQGKEGVAPVIVAPVAVPQPDGTIKPGAGALPGPATAQ